MTTTFIFFNMHFYDLYCLWSISWARLGHKEVLKLINAWNNYLECLWQVQLLQFPKGCEHFIAHDTRSKYGPVFRLFSNSYPFCIIIIRGRKMQRSIRFIEHQKFILLPYWPFWFYSYFSRLRFKRKSTVLFLVKGMLLSIRLTV